MKKTLSSFLIIISFILPLTGCKNIFGGGSDSSTADSGFAPGLDPIPTEFDLLDSSQASEQVSLSWRTPSYVKTFSLYYRVSGVGEYTKIPNVSSPYTLLGLTNGVTYDVKVEASNARGSRFSSVKQVMPTATSQTGYSLKAGDFVASSAQKKTTANSYTVSGSLSTGFGSEVKATTSPHGYTLYLSSQGNLIGGTQ